MKKIQKNAVRFDNLKQDFLDDKKYSGTAEATLNGYRYQKPEAFTALSETDKGTLMREVAPLISLDDKDEAAKRFDNFVYGLLLCELEGLPGLTRAQRQLKNTAALLEQKATIPLSQGDYIELEHIFTSELGSKEDYAREFKDTPFGLLVRKVAKLDHEAAMQAFSKFINDESLNAKQIAFVQKVIHYIEQNGYVESKAVLMKPPFDQPILFTRLFDGKTGSELMDTINSVKENATHVTA